MNSNITLRLSASTWTESLFQMCDGALARLERLIQEFAADMRGEFGQIVHDARVRRLPARGCGGQALT
ncbi:MAG: hypothetical protein ACREEP_17960 [Dongiaceae bacterium]